MQWTEGERRSVFNPSINLLDHLTRYTSHISKYKHNDSDSNERWLIRQSVWTPVQ